MTVVRSIILVMILTLATSRAQTSALELLSRARELSDSYNWVEAGPFYIAAEQGFIAAGDTRNTLYAKAGRIRSTMEKTNLHEAAAEVESDLNKPVVAFDH